MRGSNSVIACAASLLIVWMSCTSEVPTKKQIVTVVATTGMIADLVKNIGQDSVEVHALMGPGVDPHLYKATHGDLLQLQNADLILYNGLHLEGKMGEVLASLGKTKQVVAIGESIPEDSLLLDPSYPDAPDPHIWFDVKLWSMTIPAVVDQLTTLKPNCEDYFTANATNYTEELMLLDEEIRKQLELIKPESRVLITAHDAFNYFGRAYGIEVRGLQGISTLSEFGLRDRVELVDFIVERNIPSVFVETSVAEKNVMAIVEGCQQQGHEVQIGGALFSDAMGEAGTPEGTFIGMARSNANTIVHGLAGNYEN